MTTSEGGPTLDIGLVMAGSISAGAYTAGVVDFLIQALDAFDEARRSRLPHCPPHELRLGLMVGSSGGAMTAAIAAGMLHRSFEHVTDFKAPKARNNSLFESWVNQVDAIKLLGLGDLESPDRRVCSLLDSTILDKIASDAFQFEPDGPVRPPRGYLADPLEVLVTVTNLRGIPFDVNFGGCPAHSAVTSHSDFMSFSLGRNPPVDRESKHLDPGHFDHPNWSALRDAALASGAFPIALAPRPLRFNAEAYRRRAETYRGRYKPRDPMQPEGSGRPAQDSGEQDFEALCVDGGAIDNEPLDLAKKFFDRREGDHALIMIAPFPAESALAPVGKDPGRAGLVDVACRFLSGLIEHARFASAELGPDEIFSRFMISPRRERPANFGSHDVDRLPEKYALACGAVEGFGGFLDRAFRVHDYHLGRWNCQQFLRRYFTFPGDNPLFSRWPAGMKTEYAIHKERRELPPNYPGHGPVVQLPILPLMGEAKRPVHLPAWPTYDRSRLPGLERLVKHRLDAVIGRITDQELAGHSWRRLVPVAWWALGDRLIEYSIIGKIEKDLDKMGL